MMGNVFVVSHKYTNLCSISNYISQTSTTIDLNNLLYNIFTKTQKLGMSDPLFRPLAVYEVKTVAQTKAIRVVFGNKEPFLDKFRTCVKARPYQDQKLGQEFFNKEHIKPLFIAKHILTLQFLNFYHTCSEIFKIFKHRNTISIFEIFKFSARGSKKSFHYYPKSLKFVYLPCQCGLEHF